MNKKEILDDLKEHICSVDFIKADGKKRTLNCTLKSDVVPAPKATNTVARPLNDEVVAVWDVDNNGWRSFRIDSVDSFRVVS